LIKNARPMILSMIFIIILLTDEKIFTLTVRRDVMNVCILLKQSGSLAHEQRFGLPFSISE